VKGTYFLDVVGTSGGKATIEVHRPSRQAEIKTLLNAVRRPRTLRDRVKAMVRLFEPDDYPKLTQKDCRGLRSTTCELIDGNLRIGGVQYGQGAHARALLALLLNPPTNRTAKRVSR
jgi:hypothetical protein